MLGLPIVEPGLWETPMPGDPIVEPGVWENIRASSARGAVQVGSPRRGGEEMFEHG